MAGKHSYTITVKNNETESEGARYLLRTDKRFIRPDLESRKKILHILKLSDKFLRAFDLIIVEGHTNREKGFSLKSLKRCTLVELKTTKKLLPNNPKGFFFGATKNEINLAKKLGNKFKFAFVCLNPKKKSTVLMTWKEFEKLEHKKRIQYQINIVN